MSIFYNNHDNPRMISKVTKEKAYHSAISKLLAVLQFTLKGTPFVFQGDEMGLANYEFTSIDQMTDVEAKGYYEEKCRTESPEAVFSQLLAGTREHCRVLLPWNEKLPSYHAGLHQDIKEEVQQAYKDIIALRRSDKTFIYGDFEVLNKKKNRFVYRRFEGQTEYVIDCNLHKDVCKAYDLKSGYELVYTTAGKGNEMSSYEARIWKKK